MRPLYWSRIIVPNSANGESRDEIDDPKQSDDEKELWKEIDETKLDNLDEFTELFSRQSVLPYKAKELVKPMKLKKIKALDCKRSQNVGIFVRSLHFNIDVIRNAIYQCDTNVVSLETLQHILDLSASQNELENIHEAIANSSSNIPLDEPEQFLLNISSISCSNERISCIIFQSEFDDECGQVSRKNESMLKICRFLTDNSNLKKLFSIILTLGNYMNGGNRMRGQADGFGLEILGKLRDVKSKEPKVTLLHYIVRTYIRENLQNGNIVYPLPTLDDVNQVMFIDFEESYNQLNELEKKLSGKTFQ